MADPVGNRSLPIHVSVDVSAVPARPAGAGRYAVELVRQLSTAGDIVPTLICRKNDALRWEVLPGEVRVVAVAPEHRPLRLAWEQLRLPSLLGRLSPDLHHGPHYTLPERARLPMVSTIHDMTFFDHPEWHENTKVMLFRRAIKSATVKSSAIVAVSHDTAGRLKNRFGKLDVTVIPHGVDHDRFVPATGASEERDRKLLSSAGIEGDYLGYVGTLEPRKDLPTLIEAFDRIAGAHPGLKLVLGGGVGWGTKALNLAISGSLHSDRIVMTGFLPDETVPALLRQAKAIVYPSLTEGFGLPALEALACGAALVTTTGSAMEEIVDDAAVLVPPGNPEALSEAMARVLDDETFGATLRERGPQVASRYTWEASAKAHVDLYRRVVAMTDHV